MATTSDQTTEYRILLIEDDFLDEESVRRILSSAEQDFTFSTARCLQEGVDRLRAQEFDAILLDLTLPDSYGIDTIYRMLEEFDQLPIVVLSGVEDQQLAQQAVELGVEDFLIKGEVTGIEMSECLIAAVERHQPAH